MYLLAPTPNQRWTSQYSHPTSALSPSFHTSTDADEARIADLLTPSKDWWTGHKTGTARSLSREEALPKLDFGDAANDTEEETTTTTTTTTTSSRRSRGRKSNTTNEASSRTSRRSRAAEPEEEAEAAPEAAQQQQEEQPGAEESADAVDPSQYEFQGGGGDDDDDQEENDTYDRPLTPDPSSDPSGYPASPTSPLSPSAADEQRDGLSAPPSSGRRKSGTPGRHRRVWTHTVVPGVEEARIHRKGGLRL